MSTSETLASMTDSARFEAIGSAFLRTTYSHLKTLVDTGTNVKGKTRKSKLDGICNYRKNKYAGVDYTTNTSNLEKKWLSKAKKNLGDLPKAIDKMDAIRSTNPAAQFQLYLLTNQRLSEDLLDKVYAFPTPDYIEVVLIDNSILAKFLDFDPIGQYIRRDQLQIEATLLSLPLFKDLVKRNIDNYRFQFSPNDSIAEIKSRRTLLNNLQHRSNKVILLVGESGSGKSTLLYQVMIELYEKGKSSIHIYSDAIRESYSIDQALLWQLRTEAPALHITEEVVKEIVSGEIILVVDDINKDESPATLLNKLISWAAMPSSIDSKIICPVWPKNLSISDNPKGDQGTYILIKLPSLTKDDSLSLLDQKIRGRQLSLTQQQKSTLVADLGSDPLLISIYTETFGNNVHYDAHETLGILSAYITKRIAKIADTHKLPEIQYQQALLSLGLKMAGGRILLPSYNQFQAWFRNDPETMTSLKQIAFDKQIFQFTESGAILFRHDRIRDAILIQAFMVLIADPANNLITLEDPFFAELIGSALASINVTEDLAQQILTINPLAVFNALKYLQGTDHNTQFEVIRGVVTQWTTGDRVKSILKEVIAQIGSALVQFDTRDIAAILGELSNTYEITLAKLHNGDFQGGIRYFMLGEVTAGYVGNYWRDIVVAHARQHYGAVLVAELTKISPTNFTPLGRIAAYRLAGFLRDTSLAPFLERTWLPKPDKDQYPDYLFAVVHCSNSADRIILQDALTYWAEIEAAKEGRQSPLHPSESIYIHVNSIHWAITTGQADLLADIGRNNDALRSLVARVLAYVDLVPALQYVVEYISNILKTAQKGNHPRLFSDMTRWDYTKNKRRLSTESLSFLETLWGNKSNNPGIREVAFTFWSGSADPTIALRKCRKVKATDAILHYPAYKLRVKLGDQSVTPAIIRKIKEDKNIRQIDKIWNEKLKAFIYSTLKKTEFISNGYYMDQFWDLIPRIPSADAEHIVLEHWSILKKWRQAIGTALLIGTPKTIAAAASEIDLLGFAHFSKYEEHYNLVKNGIVAYAFGSDPFTPEEHKNIDHLRSSFDHMHHFFGIDRTDRELTEQKLDALIPYLKLLDELSINFFAEACLRKGWSQYLNRHLALLLDPKDRRKILPTDDDLLDEISTMGAKKIPGDPYYMISEGKRRGITNDRILAALRKFAQNIQSVADLDILCRFLIVIGTRKDLEMLDITPLPDTIDLAQAQSLKEGARYLVRRRSLS